MSPEIPAADGSSSQTQQFDGAPPMIIDPQKRYTAVVVTSKGTMTIALDPLAAPKTVNNFVFLALALLRRDRVPPDHSRLHAPRR